MLTHQPLGPPAHSGPHLPPYDLLSYYDCFIFPLFFAVLFIFIRITITTGRCATVPTSTLHVTCLLRWVGALSAVVGLIFGV